MIVKKRWIKVKTEFKGIHNWPECPYEEVAFLRDPHRHTFKVEVKIQVGHHDREIEFFRLQHQVGCIFNWLYGVARPIQLERRSCEEIAEDIGKELNSRYPHRDMVITVSEDGEVAAEIELEDEDVA